MDLNTTETEWVADHLGHSLQVEKTYYRIASTVIQKAKIAKLLILADRGQIDCMKGKTLDQLDLDGKDHGQCRFSDYFLFLGI